MFINLRRTDVNSASYTVQSSDVLIAVTFTTTAPVTITLPLATTMSVGKVIYITDEGGNAQANNITVNLSGGDTINNATSVLMNLDFMGIGIYADGVSKWFFF
jgi:hypothetical protein